MQLSVSVLISAVCLVLAVRNAWIAVLLYQGGPDESSRAACFHYSMKAVVNLWLITLVAVTPVAVNIPDYMWITLLVIKTLDFVALEIFFWDMQKVDING